MTLALAPTALERLATGRQVVLVTGTKGRTTSAYLLAAALRTAGPVAHNDTGEIMADGAVAALITQPDAGLAVLEVDELHLAAVAAATRPVVIMLLSLTRDPLDRGREVRTLALSVATALRAHPDAVLVANADDPLVVWAGDQARRAVWISAGGRSSGDASSCPRCGRRLRHGVDRQEWWCMCGLYRPTADWVASGTTVTLGDDAVVLELDLAGGFDVAHAMAAVAGASVLGVEADRAAAAMKATVR